MANKIKDDFYTVKEIFWAVPQKYPAWPYEDRHAIGVNLLTSWFRDRPVWNFFWKGAFYKISSEKAIALGTKLICPGGLLPNLIPLDACIKTQGDCPRVPVYDFDNKTSTAILRI